MRSFWLAVQFLTRLPTPNIDSPSEKDYGEAIYHYPVVGFILGFILFTLASLLDATVVSTSTGVSTNTGANISDTYNVLAGIILLVWVLLTGALHIDGLADSADAWIGGYGSKSRTLEIMKDPTCGPAGVTSVVLLLLIKFTLIKLCFNNGLHYLIIAPLISRASIQALFVTTHYARENGLGSAINKQMDIKKSAICLSITALFIAFYFPLKYCVLAILFCGLVWLGLRQLMLKRIDGFTGDTAGAWIEITECVCLLPLLFIAV